MVCCCCCCCCTFGCIDMPPILIGIIGCPILVAVLVHAVGCCHPNGAMPLMGDTETPIPPPPPPPIPIPTPPPPPDIGIFHILDEIDGTLIELAIEFTV